MPTNRPTMEELTIAVREFLEEKVQPEISDSQRFHMRVAINVLKIIERELASGAALNSAERKRLMSLLGEQGDLTELDKKLAEKISPNRTAVIIMRFIFLIVHSFLENSVISYTVQHYL